MLLAKSRVSAPWMPRFAVPRQRNRLVFAVAPPVHSVLPPSSVSVVLAEIAKFAVPLRDNRQGNLASSQDKL